MLAIYDFVPNYCAHCGRETQIKSDRAAYLNYQLRANMSCVCGMYFQRAKTDHIREAAKLSEGDTDNVLPEKKGSDSVTRIGIPKGTQKSASVQRTTQLIKKKAG